MRDQTNKAGDQPGGGAATRAMTRRSALALAAVATFGLAMGLRSLPAFAQGRMENDGERGRGRELDRDGDRYRDDDRFRDRDGERRFEGRREGKWENKGEPKADLKADLKADPRGEARWDGNSEGKEGRGPGKSGHIKLTVGGDGATAVDVKCADGEPMRACADITKEIIDKIRPPK
jgi:hypothetical protein